MAFRHSVKVPRLYKSAALILSKVKEGDNLKHLISKLKHPNKKGVMALVVKSMHFNSVIQHIFLNTGMLEKETSMDRNLATILVTELLWGKKLLQGDSKPIQVIMKYKNELLSTTNSDDLGKDEQSLQTTWRPRYVRVNTIRYTPQAIKNYFSKKTWTMASIPERYADYVEFIRSNLKGNTFVQDYHMKEVLLFPFGTSFVENPLFKNGAFVLQDKASCMTTYVLAPELGSHVLDMCAAPGMKTTHLSAYMKNHGKIYAVEKDRKRFKTLKETIARCGAKCVTPLRSDIFRVELDRAKIEYILLDPSCSGSGMLSRIEYPNTEFSQKNMKKRLKALSNLQAKLLRHALTDFPFVKRVVYSTCSIHEEENEKVIEEALSFAHNFKLINCPKMFSDWSSVGLARYSFAENCIRTVSNYDCTNGFFIAAFERKYN